MYKKLVILILIICIIILVIKITKNNEFFTNKDSDKNNYKKFVENTKEYKNKKYNLIFTGGPTLKEFKKSDLPKEIWDNCNIIAVKNSINYLNDICIEPDFLVTNFIVSASRIDIDKIPDKTINIGLNVGGMKNIREKMHHMVDIIWNKNSMMYVKNDVKDIGFKIKNNKMSSNWGHVMMELAIPLSIYLNPKTIITIGWDVKNQKNHWDTKKESFFNWSSEETIINEFSCHLHDYLKKHYNIKIYKINKNSGIRIPLLGN